MNDEIRLSDFVQEEVPSVYRPARSVHRVGGGIGAGGTGLNLWSIYDLSGAPFLAVDLASEASFPVQKSNAFAVLGDDKNRRYRKDASFVENNPMFHSGAAPIIARSRARRNVGGAQRRVLGRLGFWTQKFHAQLEGEYERWAARLAAMRTGSLQGVSVDFYTSFCGGMGGAVVLDLARDIESVLSLAETSDATFNFWFLGPKAFYGIPNPRPRAFNHAVATAEWLAHLAGPVGDIDMNTWLVELAATDDISRADAMLQVGTLANPAVRDAIDDLLANPREHLEPEYEWLGGITHCFATRIFGVSTAQVMAHISGRLAESVRVSTAPESVSCKVKVQLEEVVGLEDLRDSPILDLVMSGDVSKVVRAMVSPEPAARASLVITLEGQTVSLDTLLSLRNAASLKEIRRRLATLRRLKEQLLMDLEKAERMIEQAETVLDPSESRSAHAELAGIVDRHTPRARGGVIDSLGGSFVRQIKDVLTSPETTVPPDVRRLTRQMNDARSQLVTARAIRDLLAGDKPQAVNNRLTAAIARYEARMAEGMRVVKSSAKSVVVSPAAISLATPEMEAVVSDLVRRRREGESSRRVKEILRDQELSIHDLCLIAGLTTVTVEDFVTALVRGINEALLGAHWWGRGPMTPPDLMAVVLPNTNPQLVADIAAELNRQRPGTTLLIDRMGDGLQSISVRFFQLHLVEYLEEVFPPDYLKVLSSLLMKEKDFLTRTFPDRPWHEALGLEWPEFGGR